MLVDETNKYAWQIVAGANEESITSGSRLYDCDETMLEELYKFFSILIYMSVCNRERLDKYWTTGGVGMPCFRKIMSKNKFLLQLGFFTLH